MRTPVEIDTDLAELYAQATRADHRVDRAEDRIARIAGDRRLPFDAALAKVSVTAGNEAAGWYMTEAQRALEEWEAALADQARTRRDMAPLEAEFTRRGGWTRAFLVTNGNGHVHSTMSCSTCNRGLHRTQFAWMVEFSAADEAEIVAAAGWRACTVCFPTAPVGDKTSLPTRMFSEQDKAKAAAKEAREAARAAKAEKARAAAPTASGDPLRVEIGGRYPETFKTERAALIWATDQYTYGDPRPAEAAAIRVIAENLAEKRGVPVPEILAEIEAKGRKKALV